MKIYIVQERDEEAYIATGGAYTLGPVRGAYATKEAAEKACKACAAKGGYEPFVRPVELSE